MSAREELFDSVQFVQPNTRIFVDTNVPMYLIGAPHPHKVDAQRLLERAAAGHERLVTDAGVLQEILHRYVALDRRDAIQPAFDLLLAVVDEVFPIDQACDVIAVARPGLDERQDQQLGAALLELPASVEE